MKELTGALEILRALRPVYPSDEQFRSAFAEKQIRTTTARNRQVIRYLLFEIERQVSNYAFDYTSDKYNLEHVLPEHPAEPWTTFPDDQVDRCVFRNGNITPLTAGPNRDMGNVAYPEKRSVYQQSEFDLTRRLAAENEEWTPERIANRQRWLAHQATGIWRIAEMG